ncbi:hypothetical protein K0M31_013987 [Melipona bicolor]|uniref:Uncharacterized protein n=1 Tax=Melipona bicolor TaxID=60889 RepID=A0AA40KTV4_9HYME|nr:hypothetical protein K0M31_013987 [Melipona bicolor]
MLRNRLKEKELGYAEERSIENVKAERKEKWKRGGGGGGGGELDTRPPCRWERVNEMENGDK